MSDELLCGLCDISCVRILEHGQVSVLKYGDQLVLVGAVYHPALVIQSALLLVL